MGGAPQRLRDAVGPSTRRAARKLQRRRVVRGNCPPDKREETPRERMKGSIQTALGATPPADAAPLPAWPRGREATGADGGSPLPHRGPPKKSAEGFSSGFHPFPTPLFVLRALAASRRSLRRLRQQRYGDLDSIKHDWVYNEAKQTHKVSNKCIKLLYFQYTFNFEKYKC